MLPRHNLLKLVPASAAAVLLGLVIMVGASSANGPGVDGPIYTVTALRAQLRREPAQWVNRIVQVRAVAAVCDPCGTWLPGMVDPGANAAEQFLPVVPGDPPALPAFLRRLPLLGHLAPPQVLVFDRPTVYRVRLRRIDCLTTGDVLCAEAVLLDAAPRP